MSSAQTNAHDSFLMVDEIKTLADRYQNSYDLEIAQEILRNNEYFPKDDVDLIRF